MPGLISDVGIWVFDGALSDCALSEGKNPDTRSTLINPNISLRIPGVQLSGLTGNNSFPLLSVSVRAWVALGGLTSPPHTRPPRSLIRQGIQYPDLNRIGTF